MTAAKGSGEQKRWYLILQAVAAALIVGMVSAISLRLAVQEIAQTRREALTSQLAAIQRVVNAYQDRYDSLPTIGGQPESGAPRELDEQRLAEVGLARGFNHTPRDFNFTQGVRYGVTARGVVFAIDAQVFPSACSANLQVFTADDTTGRLTCNQLD